MKGSVGSWDNYRTEGDISGPLNDDGSVRGRLVGVYQDADSYLDHYSKKNDVFYGIIEADLTPDTLLTFGMDYQKIKPRGSSWTGNPYYFSDFSKTDFSRSFNPATDWSRRDVTAQVFPFCRRLLFETGAVDAFEQRPFLIIRHARRWPARANDSTARSARGTGPRTTARSANPELRHW